MQRTLQTGDGTVMKLCRIEVFGFTGRLETDSACTILLLLQEAVRLTIIWLHQLCVS